MTIYINRNNSSNDSRDSFRIINMPLSTFSLRVELFPEFERDPNPEGIPLPGIQQIHSLLFRNGEVVARRFPCFECRLGMLCDSCANTNGIRRSVDNTPVEEEEEGESFTEAVDGIVSDQEGEDSDVGNSSDEDEDEEEDEEESAAEDEAIDSLVWAPFR